jgi:hypothetical protein
MTCVNYSEAENISEQLSQRRPGHPTRFAEVLLFHTSQTSRELLGAKHGFGGCQIVVPVINPNYDNMIFPRRWHCR